MTDPVDTALVHANPLTDEQRAEAARMFRTERPDSGTPKWETDVPTPEERALIKAWSGTPDWTPEPRPIPEELTPDYDPVRHPKPATHFAPWAEQLDRATFDTLKELARGGIGTPDE